MDFIYVAIGLALLFFGGEALVRGSIGISKRFGLSAILIGAVVVGFGTSTPELLVSVKATLNDQPDIAIGNVVGSNIANVLLILGLAALINPVSCKDPIVLRDSLAVLLASVFLLGLAYIGVISFAAGLFMLLAIIGYIFYSYKAERREQRLHLNADGKTLHEHEVEDMEGPRLKLLPALGMSAVGIAMLVYGADLLVMGASNLARIAGVSEAVIGLSLVAVGTSLPELATSISAALKKHSDVIIGNILGSNLFNILSILGITAMIRPVPIASQFSHFDVPLTLAIAIGFSLIVYFLKGFSRVTGAACIASYAAYLTFLYV
ncbi:MAG: calcium/sodium antiporter [Alphaproteobacteria bacterium]|nr:calcium/sodium antiporter [Alphaproteobacteria bacterium]